MSKPKIGAGWLSAAWRQGLAELGAATKPLPDSIQQDVMGTIINPTPQDIDRGKRPAKEQDNDKDGKSGPEMEME